MAKKRCNCQRFRANSVYTLDQCRRCWLYFHDPAYAVRLFPPPRSFTGPLTRNLIYHVMPIAGNGVWQRNVEQLLQRIDQFNGRRVVAVVQGAGLDSAEAVEEAFKGTVDEWIVRDNDVSLREVATFPTLLDSVLRQGQNHITFFGHTKGVTRPIGQTAHRWADLMYETCLDYPHLVEDTLDHKPLAGSFKKHGRPFPGSLSSWHYSGTFFWFRNDSVEERDYARIDQQWWGVESWPGIHFHESEAGCLFLEGKLGVLDIYNPEYVKNVVEPAYANWKLGPVPWTAPTPTKFNLLYHVYPVAQNNVWRKNIAQLVKRMPLFNGKKIIAVATGGDLDPPSVVQSAFGQYADEVEILPVPNSRELREVASFIPMLEKVQSLDPREVTFYAHAKGVSTVGDRKGVMYWRNSMYKALLDNKEKLIAALSNHAVVGTHREYHPGRQNLYPDGMRDMDWHFAGTFFWFRNRDLFVRPDWRNIEPSGWALEAWPSQRFAYERSACLYKDYGNNKAQNAYDPAVYPEGNDLADDEADTGITTPVRVELGGGKYPKGNGFINIDIQAMPGVDITCDFEKLAEAGCDGEHLPFPDNSVDEVYSSHCIEHVFPFKGFLHEIVRICRIGAIVEIWAPHWNHEMAMCNDHKHVVSHTQVVHWAKTAIPHWFGNSPKRLEMHLEEFIKSPEFPEARALFPNMTDDQVLRFIPNACDQVRYQFLVMKNQYYQPKEPMTPSPNTDWR